MDVRLLGVVEVSSTTVRRPPSKARSSAHYSRCWRLHANAPLLADRLMEGLWGDRLYRDMGRSGPATRCRRR